MPKRGLPETIRMRHDEHYVEALTSSAGSPIGRMIPIDQIDPNPNQPRQVMGDLSELMASIAEKGIIEPIIVRQRGHAVSDHRRRAALPGGHPGRPARDPDRHPRSRRQRDHRGRARREPAAQGPDGVRGSRGAALARDTCDYTHEDMARRLGKSRTSITESLSLNGMPEEVKNLCRLADIHSKSLLLQIVRLGDPQKMVALVEKITRDGGATREARPKRDRQAQSLAGPRPTSSATKPQPRRSSCTCKFTKARVDRDEVITALEGIIAELRSAVGSWLAARWLEARELELRSRLAARADSRARDAQRSVAGSRPQPRGRSASRDREPRASSLASRRTSSR